MRRLGHYRARRVAPALILASLALTSLVLVPGAALAAGAATGLLALVPPEAAAHATALERIEHRLIRKPGDPEARWVRSLLQARAGDSIGARAGLDALLREVPQFALARRLLSELDGEPDRGQATPDEAVVEEARLRLQHYLAPATQLRIPRALLKLGAGTARAVVVDKQRHRLYVFENAGPEAPPRRVHDVYISTGREPGNKQVEGDLRTPAGVYFITGHIPGARLPEKYGIGAFPLDYPNPLDRRLGKTGYGIWLHGMERRYFSRPPLDSEGCVVLSNAELKALGPDLAPGTPVIIAERLEWLTAAAWQAARSEALAALEAWRTAWESGDMDAYLAHYAGDFWSTGHDRASWAALRGATARHKSWRRVRLEDLSLFAYPQEASGRPLLVARFEQHYASNNYTERSRKQLYLAREAEAWQVLYEAGY